VSGDGFRACNRENRNLIEQRAARALSAIAYHMELAIGARWRFNDHGRREGLIPMPARGFLDSFL
jgi:hypothetical protein